MDDSDDRAYSRAPELEDLVGLCRALNQEGGYVLIGGFAVILHGFVRATKDIDLLVDPSEENLPAVERAMASLPDDAAAELRDDDVQRHTVVRVADELVVDLMALACGLGYDDALTAGIDRFVVDEVEIPTAAKPFLVRTRRPTAITTRSTCATSCRASRRRREGPSSDLAELTCIHANSELPH